MKTRFKATPLALAVAAAFALSATAVWAGSENDGNDGRDPGNGIDLHTSIDVHKYIDVYGHIYIYGKVNPTGDAEAVINGDQLTTHNYVDNNYHKNDASVSNNALNSAQGNVGVNVTAGDNNIQSNELALAALDQSKVFGSAAMAQVSFDQGAFGNDTHNDPAANNATVNNNVLNGAQGNIALNVSAGDSNVQRNAAALAVGNNNLAVATIQSSQKNAGNDTYNEGKVLSWGTATKTYGRVTQKSESLDASFAAQFNASGSFSKSGSGSHNSTDETSSDQANSLQATASTTASQGTSQASVTKSIQDPMSVSVVVSNGGSGTANATADVASDTTTKDSHSWDFSKSKQFNKSFQASGSINAAKNEVLAHVTTKYVPVPQNILWSSNNATLSDNVLNGAAGNVGVNIAAGTNNLQENIMALAATASH